METTPIGLSQFLKSVTKLWLVEHSVPQVLAFVTEQSELCYRFEKLWQTNQSCFRRFESILSVTYLVKSDKKGLPSILIASETLLGSVIKFESLVLLIFFCFSKWGWGCYKAPREGGKNDMTPVKKDVLKGHHLVKNRINLRPELAPVDTSYQQ